MGKVREMPIQSHPERGAPTPGIFIEKPYAGKQRFAFVSSFLSAPETGAALSVRILEGSQAKALIVSIRCNEEN